MPDISFTPVDHDPFQDLTDYSRSLSDPSSLTPGVQDHTTPQQPTQSLADIAADPSKPMYQRISAAIPTGIGHTLGGIAQGIYSAATLPGDVAKGNIDPDSEEGIARSTNLAGLLTLPAAAPELPAADTLGIFAGAKSKTADLGALDIAQQMDRSGGFTKQDIWDHTGWFTGADGKWRYEIPDESASASPPASRSLSESGIAMPGPMPDVFSHPYLYDAYPHFKNTIGQLAVDSSQSGRAAFSRAYNDNPESITIEARTLDPEYFNSGNRSIPELGVHEIQHSIQNQEGFEPGGNYRSFLPPPQVRSQMSDDEWNKAYNAAFTKYKNLAGEVEARNVQGRMTMSPLDRLNNPPWTTEDVPKEQQILQGPRTIKFSNSQPTFTPVDHDPFASNSEEISVNDPEKIIGATYSVGNRVFTAPNHILAMDQAVNRLGLSGYGDLIDANGGLEGHHAASGFMTSSGRVVSRSEASKIAEATQQGQSSRKESLKSEDLIK